MELLGRARVVAEAVEPLFSLESLDAKWETIITPVASPEVTGNGNRENQPLTT